MTYSTNLVAFPEECFEFEDVHPDEGQDSSLANRLGIFARQRLDLPKRTIIGVCTETPLHALFLFPFSVYSSLQTGIPAPPLWFVRTPKFLFD